MPSRIFIGAPAPTRHLTSLESPLAATRWRTVHRNWSRAGSHHSVCPASLANWRMLLKIDLVHLSSSSLISLTPIFGRSSFQVSFSTSMFTAVSECTFQWPTCAYRKWVTELTWCGSSHSSESTIEGGFWGKYDKIFAVLGGNILFLFENCTLQKKPF